MKIIFFALFLAAIGMIIFAISRLIEALAYERRCRYFHIRTVITLLIVLFVTTNMYTVSWFIKIADWIINNPTLASFFNRIMPNRAYALVYMLLMVLILNIIIAVISLLTILVVKILFKRQRDYINYDDSVGIARLLHFPWFLVNRVYKNDKGEIRLTSKGFSLGKWAKGLKCVFAILCFVQVVVLAVSILWGKTTWNEQLLSISKAWYLLPMASYFMIQQIQLFLEGEFHDETGGFSSSKITPQIIAQMEELIKIYRHYFDDSGALLLSDYHKSKQFITGLQGNRLGNRQIHDCDQRDILEVVVNHIKQSDLHMNDTYKNALVELLNGKSINICDHCEGEFLLYLCSYLNFYMSQGKTVLVLCPTQERVRKVSSAIDNAMNRLNNLCSVWNVSTLEDVTDHCRVNVLICTADEFVQESIVDRRKEFTSDLFCTVLVDGFELFSRDCIRINQVFGSLRDMDWMQQYVLFTEGNNDTLRTAVELATQKEFSPFCHDTLRLGTGIMVWGEESAFRIQRQVGMGNQISPYMGTAIPLAIIAAKYDMDKIHIVESPLRADRSYWDVLSTMRSEVMNFIQKSANLQSMIRTDNSEILENSGDKIIIAYDTEYNFYHALWRWVKYGGTIKTLIHIISPSYMLREYFVAKYHKDKTLLRNNEFDSLISYHQGMKATRMAILLVNLCKEDMTERELLKKSREYGWKYENVVELLQDCLGVVLTDKEIHSVYSSFQFKRKKGFVPSKDTFESETYVSLTDDVIRKRLNNKVKLAQVVSQNNQQSPMPILAGNIYNYYLRDQIVPINGYFYQIGLISNENVYAEQKNLSQAFEYMQLCDFEFSEYKRVDTCVDTEYMDFNICTANVERKIYGYWESTNANNFGESAGITLHDLRGDNGGLVAQYKNAGILEINISRNILGDKAIETARFFAYTLKELSRTLFPYSHQNLFVAIREEDGSSYAKKVFNSIEHSLEEKVASLIPTVSPGFDTPNSDYLTLFVVEASCLEYGMVQMIYERRMDIFRMLHEYLEWYQSSRKELESWEKQRKDWKVNQVDNAEQVVCKSTTDQNENTDYVDNEATKQNVSEEQFAKPNYGKYLHFGSEHIPNVFSFDGLLNLCNKIAPTTVIPISDIKSDVVPENARVCSFCGSLTMMPIELQEGRIRRLMCSNCADHQCTAEDEVKVLYGSVFDSMKRDYNINMPENLMVRFQTADAIYKFTGIGGSADAGRVLGFYYHEGRQLWLESRGPEVALCSTIFHELTHAWQHFDHQFVNSFKHMLRKFKRKYRALVRLLLVEGHAMYVEIDGMWEHHELVYADRLRQNTENRQDEYGIGYRFVQEYLDEYRTEGSHVTPFVAMQRLVNEIIDGKEPKEKLLSLVQQLLGE